MITLFYCFPVVFVCVSQVFVPWIEERRTKFGKSEQRCLLILDSHSSRANSILLSNLHSKGIDILTIPSHSSYCLQPLDCTVNSSFKSFLRRSPLPSSDHSAPPF